MAFLLLSFSGCSTSDSTQTSRVSVRMTSAPGDYDAVYIDAQDVWVNLRWITMMVMDGWYRFQPKFIIVRWI
jgi:hypothetical protein